ncbi:MAG: phenylacetate--CoA ligase family protein [Pseudomonadota bacterium]|nr:phenylacetate--CoA ligase family protein [Pseudomonadota bacterium]
MESWNYPPEYNSAYIPNLNSQFWFPERETMDPDAREKAIIERLRLVMEHAYANSPFYRKKWDHAGIHPSQITSLENFERVPVVTKEELKQAQENFPPFGDYLCVPEAEIHHIHGTSGTTGSPTTFAIGRRDWLTIANNQARVMWGMGLRPGDTIFIGSLFSLDMGSWGALLGSERLQARTFPFGAGTPDMTSQTIVWMQKIKPKAFYGTPSYMLHLAELAVSQGIEPKDFGLEILFAYGEPGASIPSLKKRIEDLYAAKVIDCGTMAELSPWMNAAGTEQTDGMLLWQDIVYTEVCDPKSHARVNWGKQGTPIHTHLERNSQPMIRLVSGDLTHWTEGKNNPCGRTYPRLPDGIYGRIDDMFKVRGKVIYPSAINGVLNEIEGYGSEHQIIITRGSTMDELVLRIDTKGNIFKKKEKCKALQTQIEEQLDSALGVKSRVKIVSAKSMTKTQFKAKRIVDDHELYKSLITDEEKPAISIFKKP